MVIAFLPNPTEVSPFWPQELRVRVVETYAAQVAEFSTSPSVRHVAYSGIVGGALEPRLPIPTPE